MGHEHTEHRKNLWGRGRLACHYRVTLTRRSPIRFTQRTYDEGNGVCKESLKGQVCDLKVVDSVEVLTQPLVV